MTPGTSSANGLTTYPSLKLAVSILDVLADGPDETQLPVIQPLLDAVQRTHKVEGHDLSGRLFHTLLTDAKFTGALLHLRPPPPPLLSRLVFQDWPADVDWRDHEFPGSLNVADLACGTGTLLMAVATEAERRHREAGGTRSADLHKAMVEEALHGYDVQLSAVHFAATSPGHAQPGHSVRPHEPQRHVPGRGRHRDIARLPGLLGVPTRWLSSSRSRHGHGHRHGWIEPESPVAALVARPKANRSPCRTSTWPS